MGDGDGAAPAGGRRRPLRLDTWGGDLCCVDAQAVLVKRLNALPSNPTRVVLVVIIVASSEGSDYVQTY